MFLVESIIQGSQETSNIDSYIDKDASSKGTFFLSLWPTKTYGILGIALQVIGGFLLLMMVHKLFIVIPKACVILFATPIYVYVNYVSHGKNKGPINYNKDHGASNLKKHISHEHVEKGKRWDLLVQKDQGYGNQQET